MTVHHVVGAAALVIVGAWAGRVMRATYAVARRERKRKGVDA